MSILNLIDSTDVSVKQPRHQQKPTLESAPIHDIEKDHMKRLRFQSSLARLFYEQNRELKQTGVKGDEEAQPPPTPPLRRGSSVEGSGEQGQPASSEQMVTNQAEQKSNEHVGGQMPEHRPAPKGGEHHRDDQKRDAQHASSHQMEHQRAPPPVKHPHGDAKLERQSSNHSADYRPPVHKPEQQVHDPGRSVQEGGKQTEMHRKEVRYERQLSNNQSSMHQDSKQSPRLPAQSGSQYREHQSHQSRDPSMHHPPPNQRLERQLSDQPSHHHPQQRQERRLSDQPIRHHQMERPASNQWAEPQRSPARQSPRESPAYQSPRESPARQSPRDSPRESPRSPRESPRSPEHAAPAQSVRRPSNEWENRQRSPAHQDPMTRPRSSSQDSVKSQGKLFCLFVLWLRGMLPKPCCM